MATVIRLSRGGRKKLPFYHVVAADKRKARDGRYIEKLGHYDPLAEGKGKWTVDNDRLSHWLSTGAQPSKRVITYALENKLGSDAQRKKWQAEIERRKQVNIAYKEKAAAEKAAEAEAAKAEAAEAEAEAAPAEEAPAEEAPAEAAEEKKADAAEEAPNGEAPAEEAAAEEKSE